MTNSLGSKSASLARLVPHLRARGGARGRLARGAPVSPASIARSRGLRCSRVVHQVWGPCVFRAHQLSGRYITRPTHSFASVASAIRARSSIATE